MSEFTTRDQVAAKLRNVFVGLSLAESEAEIGDYSRLVDDLGVDSLDLIELTIFAEEAFELEITDSEAEGAKTFGQLVDLICSKLNIRAAA